jgi:hypothetical protein
MHGAEGLSGVGLNRQYGTCPTGKLQRCFEAAAVVFEGAAVVFEVCF